MSHRVLFHIFSFSDHPCSRGISTDKENKATRFYHFLTLPNEANPKPPALTDLLRPFFTQLRRSPFITNKLTKAPAKPAVITGYIPVAQTCNY